MGKLKDEIPSGSFSAKKESDLSPVDPCQGWVNPCEFCDRRFGDWTDADEENLAKIPSKPGIFQMAFKHKNNTEIMSIILDTNDIQKVGYETVDNAKELIADKKSKVTKSVILFRWMIFKKSDDKDVPALCAHWHNNGVLPKFLKSWPGLDILQKTESLTYSDKLQKWCYPKKDAFWKKPKQPPAKLVEVVKECKGAEPCEVCDAYFCTWKILDEVMADHKTPDSYGIYEIAVRCGKQIDRIILRYCFNNSFNLKTSLEGHRYWNYILREREHRFKENAFLQVRWIELRSLETDNSCFLFAHLLNGHPDGQSPEPEKMLEKNKRFVRRIHDSKWCYVLDEFKQHKTTKVKQRKNLLNDLEEDILYLNLADKL